MDRTLGFRVGAGDGFERAPFITSSYTLRTLVFPVFVVAVVGAGDVVERALFAAAAFTTPNKSENDLHGSALKWGFSLSNFHCTFQGCKELSSKELSSRSSPNILELELN